LSGDDDFAPVNTLMVVMSAPASSSHGSFGPSLGRICVDNYTSPGWVAPLTTLEGTEARDDDDGDEERKPTPSPTMRQFSPCVIGGVKSLLRKPVPIKRISPFDDFFQFAVNFFVPLGKRVSEQLHFILCLVMKLQQKPSEYEGLP
jgi:hypothetical protein